MSTFAFRMPAAIKAAVATQAGWAGVSMNQYLLTIVATRVSARAEADRYFAARAARSHSGCEPDGAGHDDGTGRAGAADVALGRQDQGAAPGGSRRSRRLAGPPTERTPDPPVAPPRPTHRRATALDGHGVTARATPRIRGGAEHSLDEVAHPDA